MYKKNTNWELYKKVTLFGVSRLKLDSLQSFQNLFFIFLFLQIFSSLGSAKTGSPLSKIQAKPSYQFNTNISLSGATSLYDSQYESKSESWSLELVESILTPIGTFSLMTSYNQDLKDDESITNGFSDLSISYQYFKKSLQNFTYYNDSIQSSLSTVIPLSDISLKKDELQTALSVSFGYSISPKDESGVTFSTSLSAGRNFHKYEEDINGSVLNKYSSNQALNVGYTYQDLSFNISFLHRSRWSYQNNVRGSFALSEEVTYNFNDYFSGTIGHSNEGPELKANGRDSNINFLDEENSIVYISLGLGF